MIVELWPDNHPGSLNLQPLWNSCAPISILLICVHHVPEMLCSRVLRAPQRVPSL